MHGENTDKGNPGDASWNQEDGAGKHLNARGANVKGIYECMNQDFVSPCKWTQLTSESQCYNA